MEKNFPVRSSSRFCILFEHIATSESDLSNFSSIELIPGYGRVCILLHLSYISLYVFRTSLSFAMFSIKLSKSTQSLLTLSPYFPCIFKDSLYAITESSNVLTSVPSKSKIKNFFILKSS